MRIRRRLLGVGESFHWCVYVQRNYLSYSSVKFTREELKGMPEDFINSLKKETVDGVEKYVATMKYRRSSPSVSL